MKSITLLLATTLLLGVALASPIPCPPECVCGCQANPPSDCACDEGSNIVGGLGASVDGVLGDTAALVGGAVDGLLGSSGDCPEQPEPTCPNKPPKCPNKPPPCPNKPPKCPRDCPKKPKPDCGCNKSGVDELIPA